MKIFTWPWPLTFIWPWPWVWPLTLTIWRNYFFPNFFDFFKVTWRKNVTSYVNSEGRLQKRHSIRNVAQPSRILTILDDFLKQPYHIDNIQNSENFRMTLTVDLYLTLTLSLTLTIWRNYFFPNFLDFLKVTWRKNVTSYVNSEGRLQKRHSIRNVAQPSRRLYHFRFKNYGPLCDFQWYF